ncbi:MAG TPA: BON domain-containing protein [Puia sp.]|nr:BON domain-containing protein [Puia sp.]
MRTDAQIQKDVIAQLQWDPFLNTGNIGVSVNDGVVTLSGQVDSFARKQAAESAAKKILGVKAVAEEIKVGPSLAYDRSDTDIARAVATALSWHSAVQEDRIRIKVEKGVVTLDGDVEWNYQRTAAADAIRNLNGVKWVNNAIVVKPAVLPGDVRKKIKDAMARNASLDADKISVEITGNKVVLRGNVRSLAEREDAEYAAWAAPGVSTVENKLVVEVPELAW